MSLAQPVTMTTDAWRAIGTEVLEPLAATEAELLRAWAQERSAAGSTTVWLTPEQAMLLARLLDARPELAAGLGR